MKKFLALLLGICFSLHANELVDDQPYFVVVIPSYNNKNWFERNLGSVLIQTYPHYQVLYINDCSTDGTGDLVAEYIKTKDHDAKITLINNTQRVGALANIYRAVAMSQDNHVIVLLDGDDWLAHENALLKLSQAYKDPNNWLVYTQFIQVPMNEHGWNRTFSKNEYQNPHIPRTYSPSHLRTFYAGLFKKIKLDDLLYKGQFYPMTWDMAIMLPMVEMASQGHVHFVPDVLYVYNHANPLSDHCIDAKLQQSLCAEISAKKKYKPIARLFG